MRFLLSIGLMGLLLVGCEGTFPGKRGPNTQHYLDGPAQMKVGSLNGTRYMIVNNTNFRDVYSNGEIDFYQIAGPNNLILAYSVITPNNVGDFLLDGNNLFVTDRNANQLLLWVFNGTQFVQTPFPTGWALPVSDDPQKLVKMDRTNINYPDPNHSHRPIIAIVCQTGTVIHFVDETTLQFVPGPESSQLSVSGTSQDYQYVSSRLATRLYMTPIQTTSGTDDPINFNLGERGGYGINEAIFLGGLTVTSGGGGTITDNFDTLIVASFSNVGLFGFRYFNFENNHNVVWDLAQYRNGFTDTNGVNIVGTGENGIRGMAIDGTGMIYFTNRSDNGLYRISSYEFLSENKTSDNRNTRGIGQNVTEGRLPIVFDPQRTDPGHYFARLGAVALDCDLRDGCGGPANFAYVVGLETQQVYKVDVNAQALVASSGPFVIDPHNPGNNTSQPRSEPQYVLYDKADHLVFVSNPYCDTVTVFDENLVAYSNTGLHTQVNPSCNPSH